MGKFLGEKSPLFKNAQKEHICQTCNKVFKNYIKNAKFCSKYCFDTFQRNNPRIKELSPRWKGGLCKRKDERNDSLYANWRLSVYRRDNFKCKMKDENCRGRIIAHHILKWSKYPELRYDITNGITLCCEHHPRKTTKEEQLVPLFRGLISQGGAV